MKTLLIIVLMVVPVIAEKIQAVASCARSAPGQQSSPGHPERIPPIGTRRLPGTRLVTATAYSFREPAHWRYGRLNCLGTDLDDTQVAADTRYYPLGTVLWIQGLGRRTVTDRGSAVRGQRHIDIHFCSLAAMRAWGTRRVHIRILHMPDCLMNGSRRSPSGGCSPGKTSVAGTATATN
jgi:3D (Asp-Asp-Asp) domain-containing protein